MRKCCFLFGHRDAPDELFEKICSCVIEIHQTTGICDFVVGNYGKFDRIAQRAVASSKKLQPQIRLCLLMAYHPFDRKTEIKAEYDEILFPEEAETSPKRLAIVKANEYMIRSSSAFIVYVNHPGNSKKMLDKVMKRACAETLPILRLP